MQSLVVSLIVLAAIVYAAWYWMPAGLRRGLAARVSGRSQKLASTIAQAPGCSACESCASCGNPGEATSREQQANQKASWAPPSSQPVRVVRTGIDR